MSVKKIRTTKKGIEVYSLENANGMRAEIITYGARLDKLFVPARNGDFINVLAGFDDADGYLGDNPHFNGIIGRVANRIGNARFTLNGREYKLCANDNGNCLHGGSIGFDCRMFEAEITGENALTLTYFSPDGEENFPSNLTLKVTYGLTEDNGIEISYDAHCDAPTVFNPTNHAYFNLDGDFETVLNHELFIDSLYMTPSDENLICSGEIYGVKDTPYDFSVPKAIGRDIRSSHIYMKNARGGYDFNYILTPNRDVGLPAAYAISRKTGIKMEVYTDRPCLQLYTGNFLDGSVVGRSPYAYQSLFCLETQGYPNACNVPSFPSSLLSPEEDFKSVTLYKFLGVDERL